jgi:hypothetical protein
MTSAWMSAFSHVRHVASRYYSCLIQWFVLKVNSYSFGPAVPCRSLRRSLMWSQDPVTGPCPQLVQFSPHPHLTS